MKHAITARPAPRGRYLVMAVAAIAALRCAATTTLADEPVATHSGKISGELLDASTGLEAFRGIPFAAPPTGTLRWRPPQDVAPWTGVRVCTVFGAVCPQRPGLTGLVGDPLPPQNEDCLFLNVWTANARREARLPVMVWIHGGGFNVGWSDQTAYEGSAFAKRGVVLVTINYRLGPLGFLAHPALSAESSRAVSGNYGLLDQIAALKWVQKNISTFGGDAGNVTIFGESAGATSVDALCASPLAKGLFHRAIAQSPGITDGSYAFLKHSSPRASSSEEAGKSWASRFLEEDSDDGLGTLRRLATAELVARSDGFRPVITIDGWFMPDFSENRFAQGKQNAVSLIVGTSTDEGTIFLNSYPYRTVDTYREGMQNRYGDAAQDILKLYPVASDEDIPAALNAYISDTWFLRGATGMLRGMSAVSDDVFQYVFTHRSQAYPARGAYHSAEMYYVFNTLHPAAKKSEDPHLADAMIRYWVQFAKTGNPNTKGLPVWPRYDTDSARYLELGDEIKTGAAYRHRPVQILNGIRDSDR